MREALDDIPMQTPGFRTSGMRRDPVAILRQMVANSQRQEAAAIAPPATSRDGKRPRSGSGPATEPKRLKMVEEPKRPGRENFKDIWQLKEPRPCCVQVGLTEELIIGSTQRAKLGYSVRVYLDGGKYGEPAVTLEIKINTTGKDLGKDKYDKTCTVTWEPGVMVDGQWMMEDAAWVSPRQLESTVKDPTRRELIEETCFPAEVRATLRSKWEKGNIMLFKFQSNVPKSTEWDPHWTDQLAREDANSVNSAMTGLFNTRHTSAQVAIFFVAQQAGATRVGDHILDYLVDATAKHLPPLVQYMDEQMKPILDYSLPSVDGIGTGMYVNYPTKPTPSGQRVRDVASKKMFHNFPLRHNWNKISSFAIIQGVPVVREMQHARGLHEPLEKSWHHIFLQTLPVFQSDGRAIKLDSKMDHSFWAGVRMTRDPVTGLKEDIPKPGTTVLLDINNADGNNPHVRDPKGFWYGRVQVKGRVWHQTNGTDFCIFVTKPRTSKIRGEKFYSKNRMLDNSKLLLARLEVRTNLTPQIRNLNAFKKFCDEDFHGALLDEMRLALWAEPNRADPDTFADLTLGPQGKTSAENRRKYMQHVDEVTATASLNASQESVLRSPCKMRRNITCVTGPAGAGKSKTITNEMIGLTKIGHKILLVAGSNVAVDANAVATWSAMSTDQRSGPNAIKLLRLETDAAEKAARLSKMSYADYAGIPEEQLGNPSEYAEPESAQDNPAIRNTLERIVSEFASREKALETCLQQYKDVNEAYQAVKKIDTLRKSNVPVATTLDYRIWEIVDKCRRDAEAKYAAARETMGPEEFSKLYNASEISMEQFDDCAKYRTYMSNYMKNRGKLTGTERTAFETEHDHLVSQVLKETDILFTTCSNAGGELLTSDNTFSPTMIFCDEASQVSIPEICVPLTTFTKWECLVLVGDSLQFNPTVTSTVVNEFGPNARLSPLALLQEKGFPTILLDEQYRMAPALSQFPRAQFYDGKGLKDSQKVKSDNDVRETIRGWTLQIPDVHGYKGKGTEYLVVDIPYGCSRQEPNGTSLVNYANATVVIIIIERLLKEKAIKPSMFKVLCYYEGQVRLINRMIREDLESDENVKKAIVVTTVDSFRGKEGQIVILDTVVARDLLLSYVGKPAGKKPATETPNDSSDDDSGQESEIRWASVPKHVRDQNRLHIGLTRGIDSTIVLCQTGLLRSTAKFARGKRYNCLVNMVSDAANRKCLAVNRQLDMHPDAVHYRESAGVTDAELARREDEQENPDFVKQCIGYWKSSCRRKQPSAFNKPDIYHTSKGDTTRPIGNRELAARADKHDKEVAEKKKLPEEEDGQLDPALRAYESEYPPLPGAKGDEMDID